VRGEVVIDPVFEGVVQIVGVIDLVYGQEVALGEVVPLIELVRERVIVAVIDRV